MKAEPQDLAREALCHLLPLLRCTRMGACPYGPQERAGDHQHSDHLGDPHSPPEGTWWAHMGWIITGRALNAQTEALAHYAPDLAKDPVQVWLNRYHWVPLTILGIGLLLVGTLIGGIRAGVGLFLWGTFLRVTLSLHATWLVNSATHLHGGRLFATRDESRNSCSVAPCESGFCPAWPCMV